MDQPPPGPPPEEHVPPRSRVANLPAYPRPLQESPGGAARRRRPSVWWFVLTVTMFVAACVLGVVLVVSFATGLTKLSDVDATVPATDVVTSVDLTPHTSYLLWDQAVYRDECQVIDTRSGTEANTSDLHATSFTRTDRSGSWYGARYLDSGSGSLQIRCPAEGGPIQIGARPVSGHVLGNTGATVLAMVLLGTAGLLGFVVTLAMYVGGEPRRTAARP